MAAELDALDKALLDQVQAAFPLCPRPYEALGQACGVEEREVQRRLCLLKDRRILRQISAIFDSRALGYRSALVAAQAPAERLAEAAGVVSAHPGVSHNYEREHALNLWFTLAVPPGTDLAAELKSLACRAGLARAELLPSLRTFRIGVRFDLSAGKAQAAPSAPSRRQPEPMTDSLDQAVVRELQEDLPLSPQPFASMAQRLDMTQDGLFNWMAEAGRKGWLRRFAGVLRHREAGFGEGGMGVWAVPEEQAETMGQAFAAEPAVTHCYQRPTFDGWPYNLFTMVHGHDRADCVAVLDGLAQRVGGWRERAVLFSTTEFKKERVKYFLEGAPPVGVRP
jgi:DNA-binding Lrp family transcriptional regulator